MPRVRTFRSDNNAGLCPEALAALSAASEEGHVVGYGDDPATARAVERFVELFGDSIAVYFVATGTAANVLSIAALTEPWQRIVCHRHSHLNDDESTAPERIAQCRMTWVESHPSKLRPADVERIAAAGRGDVHEPAAGVVSISNATEFGSVYAPDEVAAIAEAAHAGGFRLHVDGARFANAVASVGCNARELAGEAGVDALSFGGTKNGLAFGEAVVFFRQGDGRWFDRARATFEHHRKSTGHLLSKHRFVAAPFAATLDRGVWLGHAAHANAMARRLAEGLRRLGLEPAHPVEANGVFVRLPRAVDEALVAAGHGYYPFGDSEQGLSRLMCSFDTAPEQVEGLLRDVERALASE